MRHDSHATEIPLLEIQVEILAEELSMERFLRAKLPEMLPPGYLLDGNVFIRAHNGKQDLMRSIPAKVRAFSHYHRPARIIILHDQDSHDCVSLKQEIIRLCTSSGSCPVPVRIACRELENWYLGDLDAIEQAYPGFRADRHKRKAKFLDPDRCHGAEELRKLIPGFQKGLASRDIPPCLDLSRNRSPSLGHLVSGIRRFLAPSGIAP